MGSGRSLKPFTCQQEKRVPTQAGKSLRGSGGCRESSRTRLWALPWGRCSWLPPAPLLPTLHSASHWQPERGQSERTAPSGAGTPTFISVSLLSGSALLPSLLGVPRQGPTFQEKAWSHIRCVRGAWACSPTGSVCQEDQNRSCHTGDTGNRFPWASTASSIIWK